MLSLASLMAPAPGQKGGMSLLLIQLLLIGMVFYFLILRRSPRRGGSTPRC